MMGLRRLRAAAPKGDFVRGALTIAGGTGAAQLLTIAVSPIVTRLYAPSDYGAYAVAASLLAIVIAVACLGYEVAVPLPKSAGGAANLLVLCLIVAAVVSLLTIPFMLLLGSALFATASRSTVDAYVVLMPLGVFGGSALAALTGWMVRTKSYNEIAANRMTQSGALVISQVGLGIAGAGGVGLLVATVASSLVATARLAVVAWRSDAAAFTAVSREEMLATARRYRRFPTFSAPSALLNTIGLVAPVLLMVGLYGTTVGGQFAFAQRVMGLPVILIAAAVGQVYFAEAARLIHERPEELRGLYKRTTRTLALTGALPFLVGALLAPFVFGIVFGQAWTEAGIYAAILAPMYFLQFIAAPASGTLDVLERQEQHFLREILRLAMLGGSLVVAGLLHLPSFEAVALLSATGCLTYGLYSYSAWRAILGVRAASATEPSTDIDPNLYISPGPEL